MITANIHHDATCLSDYWGGTAEPARAAIMVDGTTTYRQIIDQLDGEEWAVEWSEYSDAHNEALKKALASLRAELSGKLDEKLDDSLEIYEDGDDSWDLNAFFVLSFTTED